jgi:hypothetical protein
MFIVLCGAINPCMAESADSLSHQAAGDCTGFSSASEGFDVALGRIGAGAPRTYFVRNASDAKGCPNAAKACRAKAFLVPGDRVILGRTSGSFVCADFIGRKGMTRSGWLPADAVIMETHPPISLDDWLGQWSQIEATITIKRGKKPGELSVAGDATWGALDPDRVKRGAVHVGSIEGAVSPNGADLSFAMGEGATLPVDKGEESDCKVWMHRIGPYLLVKDNNNCGGMNVSFWGIYTRNANPPR